MAYRNAGEGSDKGLEHLPLPIASLLSDYARENNEEIKLHRLVDAAELVTRFCTVLMLSDLAGAGMSQRLKDTLARNLAFPSFGKWKGILRASVADLDQATAGCFVPELPQFVEQVLLRSLDASRDYIGIITTRNWLVHSAWASRSWIHDALADSEPVLSGIVNGLQFMSNYDLVGCDSDGRVYCLKGPYSDGQPRQGLSTDVPRGTVALIRHGQCLNLYPLCAFGGSVSQGAVPYMHMYSSSRPERRSIEYTVFGGDRLRAQGWSEVASRFYELFALDEWSGGQSDQSRWIERKIDTLTDGFVGRTKELGLIEDAIRHNAGRVLWVSGRRGVGKSSLMAEAARRLIESRDSTIVIPYFFRRGETGCSIYDFLVTAIERLDPQATYSTAPDEQLQAFRDLLVQVSGRGDQAVIFVVDGVDEICALDPSFARIPLSCNMDNVTWICSGVTGQQPEPMLLSAGVANLFTHGLSGLDEKSVYAMLIDGLPGEIRNELIGQRVMDGDAPSNPIVTQLVKRSDGLALYVTMVIGELREGRRSLQSVADLPQGLAAYYERLFVGSGLTDQAVALTALLGALSLAVEPVDEQTLARVVGQSMPGGPKLWERVIRDALDRAHAFLASMPTPEGSPGFLLYHESLRQFLLEHAGVRLMREGARAAWLQYCGEWSSSTAPYALRNCAHHLRDAGEHERLIELARDTRFLALQRDRLTHNPLAPITTLRLALDAAIDSGDTAAIVELAMAGAQQRLALRQVSPMQALDQGGVQLALQLADSYPNAERIIWYCLLARALADGSDFGQAQTVWRQAESMMADARAKTDLPQYVRDCADFLREGVSCSFTPSGADTPAFDASEQKGVCEYLASATRERQLSDLLSAGDLAGAEHVASLMDDSTGQRGHALASIAVRRAEMAQPDTIPKSYGLSFEVAEGIVHGSNMCMALCIIAERQASRGDIQCAAATFSAAIAACEGIADDMSRSSALRWVASSMSNCGLCIDTAAVSRMLAPDDLADVLLFAARSAVHAGNDSVVQQLVREAADAAASLDSAPDKRETLMEAAQILADVGDHLGASRLLQHTACVTPYDPRYLSRLIDMARRIGCEELERRAYESLDSSMQTALCRKTASDRIIGALGVAEAQSSLGDARGAVQTLEKAVLQSDIQSLNHLKAETLLVIAGAMESSGDSDYARMCAEKALQIISSLRSREHSSDLRLRAVSLLARLGEFDGAYELADAMNAGRDQVDAYLRIAAGVAARRGTEHTSRCHEIVQSIVDSDTAASCMATAERAECAVLLAESYNRNGLGDLAKIGLAQAKELLTDIEVGDALFSAFRHVVQAELEIAGFDDALETIRLPLTKSGFPDLVGDAPAVFISLYRLLAPAAVSPEQRDRLDYDVQWSFLEVQRGRYSISDDRHLQDALRELSAVDVGILRFDSAEWRARLAWLWGGSRCDWRSRENVITGMVRAYVGSDQIDQAWALYRSITGRFEHDYPVLPGVARGDCLLVLAEGESRRNDLRLAAELLGDAASTALSEGVAKADESVLEVLADIIVLQHRLGFASDALSTLNFVMASACWPVRRVVSTIAATKCGSLLSEVWRDSSAHQEIAHYLCQAAACDDLDMALSAAMALMEE